MSSQHIAPPRRITTTQRRQLELLSLLASDAAGEIPEPELDGAQFAESFLESIAHSSWVKTRYRGTVGQGYIAWSITDSGRAKLAELDQLPGARTRGGR